MSYNHFTLTERKYLQELLSDGYKLRKIADILERDVSSISREIARNKARYRPRHKPDNPYWYNHWRAQNLYTERRRVNRIRAFLPHTKEWQYVVDRLRRYWSPETIAGRWHKDFPTLRKLSVSTIYRHIEKGLFPDIAPKTHLRRRGKRIISRKSNYNTIHPDRLIPDWPEVIKQRERIGDWEGDTVYGGIGKGLLVTMVDRKSRFLCAMLIPKRDASLVRNVICKMLKEHPVKSISLDNGSEFAAFREVEEILHTEVYFAEPHKPWQRGTNENTNDILRFFFEKGCDFHSVTQEQVDKVVSLINNRPKKCLGWKTPAEVFFAESVALT